jgi:hypothetical protein
LAGRGALQRALAGGIRRIAEAVCAKAAGCPSGSQKTFRVIGKKN